MSFDASVLLEEGKGGWTRRCGAFSLLRCWFPRAFWKEGHLAVRISAKTPADRMERTGLQDKHTVLPVVALEENLLSPNKEVMKEQ